MKVQIQSLIVAAVILCLPAMGFCEDEDVWGPEASAFRPPSPSTPRGAWPPRMSGQWATSWDFIWTSTRSPIGASPPGPPATAPGVR